MLRGVEFSDSKPHIKDDGHGEEGEREGEEVGEVKGGRGGGIGGGRGEEVGPAWDINHHGQEED